MSELKTLSAQQRSAFGKGHNRRLRTRAMVPGVYYTPDGKNIPVQMAELPLAKIYEQVGRTNVFNLEIEFEDGTKKMHPVFVWDAQYSPVKGTFTHVDFYGVDLDKEIKVKVQVEYTSLPPGLTHAPAAFRMLLCRAAQPAGEELFHSAREEGSRRNMPSPEQGASASTASKAPFRNAAASF